ncbi:MAG: N-acetyl-gamma-glutamyl-phosphate reductase [Myxococcota bacterium]
MSERRVVVLGASGYGGGELLRLLAQHPERPLVRGVSRSYAGKPFHAVHPNLRGVLQGTFDANVDWAWLSESDKPVLFCAMPHGELSQQYKTLAASAPGETWRRLTLIDLSADFRIHDVDLYKRFYKVEHPCPDEIPAFTYGFCEWQHDSIKAAKRIANPGCFATALQLALLPLAKHQVGLIAVSGVTGSSGSGMKLAETTHHPTRAHDFRAYKALGHQHQAEAIQLMLALGVDGELGFVPHSAPIVRGIFLTVQLAGVGDVRAKFEKAYAAAPFVRLVEESPRLASVVGSNFVDIGFATQGKVTAIMVALDNLVKGMAGQAIQNMNLATGLDERAGLWSAAAYPA